MENENKEIVTETNQEVKMARLVLNSQNSEEVRRTIDELSVYLMKKMRSFTGSWRINHDITVNRVVTCI